MRDIRNLWQQLPCPECDAQIWSHPSEMNSLNDQRVRCLNCGKDFDTAWLEYLLDLKDKDDYLFRLRVGLKRSGHTQQELANLVDCSVSNISAQINKRAPLSFRVWKAARVWVLPHYICDNCGSVTRHIDINATTNAILCPKCGLVHQHA